MGDFIKGLFEITVDSINLTSFFTCRLLDNFFSSHDLLSESNVTFVSALFHQLKSTLILLPVKRLHSFRSWFTPKLSDFQRRSWTMPMSQNVNGWWCSLRVPSMSNVGRDAGASAALLFPVGLAYYVCAQEASNVWVSYPPFASIAKGEVFVFGRPLGQAIATGNPSVCLSVTLVYCGQTA